MKMKKSQKQEKNAFIEAHTATKRAWVMVLFILFTLFLFGSVSAFEFDNGIKYENNDMKVIIENGYFFGIGEWFGFNTSLGSAELKSHKSVNDVLEFGYGSEEVVIYYDFFNWELYKNGLGEVYFTDKRTGKIIEKDYYFVERVSKIEIRNIFDNILTGYSKNGTAIYEQKVIGTYEEETFEWVKLNDKDIPNRSIRIGLKTYVDKEDYIDAIWTIAGKKIKKHASWNASLEVNLLAWYDFNFTSGSVVDWTGNFSGTNFGATRGVDGKINNSFDFDGISDYVQTQDIQSGSWSEFAISIWAKAEGGGNGEQLINKYYDGSLRSFSMNYNNSGFSAPSFGGAYNGVNSGVGDQFNSSGDLNQGQWNHILVSYKDPYLVFYVNGIESGNFTHAGGMNDNAEEVYFGMQGYDPGLWFDGRIDLAGFWNRELSPSEALDLFNSDEGISPSGHLEGFFPTINLNSPVDNYNSSSQTIVFNGTAYDNFNLTNVSLILDSAYNETNISGLNNSNYIFNKVLADGNYTWTYEACNNESLCTNAITRDFMIDTTDPLINITTILNTTYIDNYSISSTINISLNWTVSDTNLDSCWYYNTTANVSITCGNNVTITLPYGGYTFIVYANDSVGHLSSSSITATWAYKLLQNSITYNADAFELSNEEFKINVSSTGEQTVASSIVYNGTSYSANKAGDNILMEFSRTIPIYTAGNNSFYWSFGYGSEIINSSTYFQNISETNLANCTNGTKYFNLLLKDEKTMEFLSSSNNISIETVFIYYINDISVNKTFVSSFNQNNVSFCLDPPIENVKVFGEISYDDDLHVKERHFILFESFTNSTTTNISLYNIAASESTSFLVFTETEGAPYPDVYMKLKRQYLNLNDFVVVEMAKADSFGQTVLHFVTEDEIYKIDFYDEDGNLVLTTEPFQAVCIDNVCSMSFKVDPEGGIIPPFQGISPDGNLVFTLSLVGNDTAVLLNYVSTNGSAYNLQMKTAGFSIVNDTVIVCTETQTNTISGSMSCNISSYPFTTYVTELWVDDVLNDIQYSSVTNDAWKDFGNEGIIYAILIIMALTLLLIYTPELCVLGSIAGVLISAKFGFIPMTYVSGMYLVVAGIIIVYKMRKN